MFGAALGYFSYLLIESIAIGVFGLLLSRKQKNQYDTGKALLIIVSILVLQMLLMTPLLTFADLRINNKELIELLGTDKVNSLIGFDVSSLLTPIFQALVGIIVGKRVIQKLLK